MGCIYVKYEANFSYKHGAIETQQKNSKDLYDLAWLLTWDVHAFIIVWYKSLEEISWRSNDRHMVKQGISWCKSPAERGIRVSVYHNI